MIIIFNASKLLFLEGVQVHGGEKANDSQDSALREAQTMNKLIL